MLKRYNMNKVRWYAMLLCGVPFPLTDEEEQRREERRRAAEAYLSSYFAAIARCGVMPYFIGR